MGAALRARWGCPGPAEAGQGAMQAVCAKCSRLMCRAVVLFLVAECAQTTPMTAPLPGDPNFSIDGSVAFFKSGESNPTQPNPPPTPPSLVLLWSLRRLRTLFGPGRCPNRVHCHSRSECRGGGGGQGPVGRGQTHLRGEGGDGHDPQRPEPALLYNSPGRSAGRGPGMSLPMSVCACGVPRPLRGGWWRLHPRGGGAADAQTAHPATFSTAPTHQPLGSANAETTPARAPAAAADRTQRPDATCEGKNG